MSNLTDELYRVHRILQGKEKCPELLNDYFCGLTQKVSGRTHPCPVEHGGKCYIDKETEDNE